MRYLVLLLCLTVSTLVAADRPNVVVILADDYGYGSAGCYGANPGLVRTPNIDRLANEGRRFTDANTTSSVCSPTRYSVLTGRYCWRTLRRDTERACPARLPSGCLPRGGVLARDSTWPSSTDATVLCSPHTSVLASRFLCPCCPLAAGSSGPPGGVFPFRA